MAIPRISTNDGKRFVVLADEKLTAFVELEAAICKADKEIVVFFTPNNAERLKLFSAKYGKLARALGFHSIWIVGVHTFLVTQLA